MNNPIPVPSKGDGLKATWAASVANGINALMPMAAAGMLARDGAGGVGYEPLPKNQRNRIGSSYIPPWTFRCTIENSGESNETRTGGWFNARLQVGLNCNVTGFAWPDLSPSESEDITGVTQTDDGIYYAEVDLAEEKAEIKIASGGIIPGNDFEHNKVNVFIGEVQDGVQVNGIFCVPCVYKRID